MTLRHKINPPLYDYNLIKLQVRIIEMAFSPTRGNGARKNDAVIARYLGISTKTWDKVASGFDEWPWWPTVLREVIELVIPHTKGLQVRTEMNKLLRQLPPQHQAAIEKASAARDWLIDQLKDGPALGSELLSTANRGMLTERTIRRAANSLGVIYKRKGKGKDHESTWSLPRDKDYS